MRNKRNTVIFLICYLSYASIYIARLNLSMASPDLINLSILTTAQVGILGSVFSVIFAMGRLINGSLSDKTPAWIMISSGLAIASISNMAIGFFPPFIAILILWSANAYAQSMLWSSILCMISNIYDEATAKRKTSYIVTSVAAGNILGIIVNTGIINTFGMKFAFIIPGGLTLIYCTLIILITRNINTYTILSNTHIPIYSLFKLREIRLTIFPAMLHGVMKDNISLWMTVFFVNRYSINLTQSAYFVLFIPIIGFLGRALYPACYKLCGNREHLVSVFAFSVCAVSSVPLCFNGISPFTAVICLSLIYAAVSIINTSLISIFPIHFISSGNVASVSGIMDFATYFGAGITAFIYGIIIDSVGFSPMFISWTVISVISLCILLSLDTAASKGDAVIVRNI